MPLSESILAVALLLTLGMLIAAVSRRWPIPYTVLLVVIGLLLNIASAKVAWLEPLQAMQLAPDWVLFVFLPVLIFESGLNLNARDLLKELGPVLVLAVPALLLSTLAIGFAVQSFLPVTLGAALVFGALISATDPVAVVALFKELGAPQRLTVLVEGESLFNDATAIVMFKILLVVAMTGVMEWSTASTAALQFIEVFIGGALAGIVLGTVFGIMMRIMHADTPAVLVLSVVFAYLTFTLAEHSLHLSGVMAVVTGALTIGLVAMPRLSLHTGHAMHETWEFLALVANTLLFVLVGFAVDINSLLAQLDVIVLAFVTVTVVRAALVYSAVPLVVKLFALPRVALGDRHIMWWGGLKGGLAIAVVLSIPVDMPGRQLLVDITLGVVLLSLLINAPTIRPLMRWLGMDRLTDDERQELRRGLARARSSGHRIAELLHDAELLSRRGFHRTITQLNAALASEPSAHDHGQAMRQARLLGLRAEGATLEDLYKGRMISYYNFLDLNNEIIRARAHVADSDETPRRRRNLFLWLEFTLIRWLREQNFAALLLTRYQDARLSQHLVKDAARVLMAQDAIDALQREPELDELSREQVIAHYQQRLTVLLASIKHVEAEFPDYYSAFEQRFAQRAALDAAELEIEAQARDGALSPKPVAAIQRIFQRATDAIPPLQRAVAEPSANELLGMVDLFSGLVEDDLAQIARHARSVHFLPQDTIIGEGEHGDALYVIIRGRVTVSKQLHGAQQTLTELGPGEFFGEMALLGESIRKATVVALQASTLLRVTRDDVIGAAAKSPQIKQQLEAMHAERSAVP